MEHTLGLIGLGGGVFIVLTLGLGFAVLLFDEILDDLPKWIMRIKAIRKDFKRENNRV